MRDFSHFTQFVKGWTILHIHQRPFLKRYEKKYIVANSYDILACFKIFKELIETTRTGTEKRVLDFYKKFLMESEEGFDVATLTCNYNKKSKTKLSDYTIRNWLNRLNEIGYVQKYEDSSDKRKYLYKPVLKNAEILENVGKIENPQDLLHKIEKDFKSWKKNIGKDNEIKIKKNFTHNSNISLDELESLLFVDEKNCLSYYANLFNDLKNPDLEPDSKIETKNCLKPKKPLISTNSKKKNLDKMLQRQTIEKNEVIFKGQKVSVKLPKRWHTGKEAKD